jgi:hypothetical protein
MASILRPRNFGVFRSIVANWDPKSHRPISLVWDIQPWAFAQAVLQMRDKLHICTHGTPFNRITAYALSVLIQQEERFESYILHKLVLTMPGNDDDDDHKSSPLSLTVSSVNRLASYFSLRPNEMLAHKCFGWVKSQLDGQFLDAEPDETRHERVWKLARSLQHVIFPHYIKYVLHYAYGVHQADVFLEAYERASCVPVVESTCPEQVRLSEKFYLVNEANPDKQREKFRFRNICATFDQLNEWKTSTCQIWDC